MTFKEILDEVLQDNFKGEALARAKRWVVRREQAVWNLPDVRWDFSLFRDLEVEVAAGNGSVALPALVRDVDTVYLDDGSRLEEGSGRQFDSVAFNTTSQGTPALFTVLARTIYLTPAPSSDRTLRLSGTYRRYHLDDAGQMIPGPMANDTDTPAWDSAHHHVLVPGAISTGLIMENDPTWPGFDQEWKEELDAMAEALHSPEVGVQWPRRVEC